MRVVPIWMHVSPSSQGHKSLLALKWPSSSPAMVHNKLFLYKRNLFNFIVVEPNALIYMGKDKYESKAFNY